ncbi:transcriptional regulator [Bradyrhizobium sp. USDA 10063]
MECVEMQITGAQVRAARAFLKWTIADLAEAADVGISTVQEIEKVEPRAVSGHWRVSAREEALEKVRRAFTNAGITFTSTSTQIGIRGPIK